MIPHRDALQPFPDGAVGRQGQHRTGSGCPQVGTKYVGGWHRTLDCEKRAFLRGKLRMLSNVPSMVEKQFINNNWNDVYMDSSKCHKEAIVYGPPGDILWDGSGV